MNTFHIPSTLEKSANSFEVGGVASSFHRDLDGEAITPDAVRLAIPAFMAQRGADGIQGGPLHLHHGFYDSFIRRAIDSLRLPVSDQMNMVAAIALPLGRVTEMWVDDQGVTHWRGRLSSANPVAQIIWQMLKENLIHLGVSLGGKILATQAGGRDALGRPCTLITSIRLDELSITSNPALRLTEGEDTGAYISALAKSISTVFSTPAAKLTPRKTMVRLSPRNKEKSDRAQVQRFLSKAIGSVHSTEEFANKSNKAFRAIPKDVTKPGLDHGVNEPKSTTPHGGGKIQVDSTETKTGIGGTSQGMTVPRGKTGIPTEVWGFTVKEFTQELAKCGQMGKEAWGSDDMGNFLTHGAYGLTNIAETPPDVLIDLVRFLQRLSQFAVEVPYMGNYQSQDAIAAMTGDLHKALEDFKEKMPEDLMQKPFRPPGSPSISGLDIVFPQQYSQY